MTELIADHVNPEPPSVLHLDLNSCFATIEQQANPFLRGRPVAVAPYPTPRGIVVAPSVEAKRLGCKVGMRVEECRILAPGIVILPVDPQKYRFVHLEFKKLLSRYTDRVVPKSIDEFVLRLDHTPSFKRGMVTVGEEIKHRIKREIGNYLTVSVGIGLNRFLAKTAAGLHKPDGLDVIDQRNYLDIYAQLQLRDLCGINTGNTVRLNTVGVYSVLDFYRASVGLLRQGFHSVLGFRWYAKLRGWEVDAQEDRRKSFGNAYALPKPLILEDEVTPILAKLVEKTGYRMRRAGYRARGVAFACLYQDGGYWHQDVTLPREVFDSQEIYRVVYQTYLRAPKRPLSHLSVCCFSLVDADEVQLEILEDLERTRAKVAAIDAINTRYGRFTIAPARMLGTEKNVQDRISFGSVKELESFLFGETGEEQGCER